jgi:single-stranded-DNA-specific exonuclease
MSDSTAFYRQQQNSTAIPTKSECLEISVVGVTFENRQSIIARLKVGEPIILRRDPENPYDRNAIAVETANRQSIGFVNRDLALRLAPAFDRYGKDVFGVVTALVGGQLKGSALGVRVRFVAPEAIPVQLPSLQDEL